MTGDGELRAGTGSMKPARLRDLEGRDRMLAIGIVALVLLPFVVALLRAFGDGWIPSGDEANIATRAFDVFSRHPPLTGLPSTSALYGNQIQTNHPGPIEFYLLAVPLRALGLTTGPLLTAAAINASCVLIALWVFFRHLGLTAMLWAGVLLLAVMWSGGTAVLTDTLSSNMTMYSLLATAVLAWAVIDGDLRLLPLAAFVASYAAQQHLAAGLIVAALVAVTALVLGFQLVRRVRRGETTITKSALRRPGIALAITVVCWVPVAIDELTTHPGNLTKIVKFARDNTRPTVGLKLGLYQSLHAVIPPTILARTDTTGSFFLGSPGAFRIALGVLVIVVLAAIALWARTDAPSLARLALVALVLLGAGLINGANVPLSFERERVNLYRWTWAAAFASCAAIGIAAVLLLGRWLRRSSAGPRSFTSRAPRVGPVALLAAAALVAASIVVVHGADDHNRELPEFAVEKRVDRVVLAHIDRNRPVVVTSTGNDAFLSVGPQLISRLVQMGMTVEVPALATTYGSHRIFRASTQPTGIFITSGKAQRPSGPGDVIAVESFGPQAAAAFRALSARRTTLLDDLSNAALGVKVALAPGAVALIDRDYSAADRRDIDLRLAFLSKLPRPAFEDPVFLRVVAQGILSAPAVDASEARQLLELPTYHYTGTWGDEQVAVHLVSAAATPACLKHSCFSTG